MRARPSLLVLALLLGAPAVAAGQPLGADRRNFDEGEASFQAAMAAQQRGEPERADELLDEAEARFRAALGALPGDPQALARLGAILYQRGRHDDARELLERAPAEAAQAPELQFQLALVLEALGEHARALPIAAAAAAARPGSAPAQALHGRLLLHAGKPDAAAVALERAALGGLERDVRTAESLGQVLFRLGRFERALRPLEVCVAAEPKVPRHVRNLAAALAAAGQPRRALELLDRLGARERERPKTREIRAYALLAARDFAGAAQAARTLPLGARAHALEGAALAGLGRDGEARAAFGRALGMQPDLGDAHAGLGLLYERARAPKAALPHLERAAAALPRRVGVCLALGRTLRALERHVEAVATLRRCVGVAPGDPAAHVALGTALLSPAATDATIADAVAAFDRARALDPRDPAPRDGAVRARRTRARRLYERGQLEPARAELARALEVSPRDAAALRDVAVILLELGSAGRAAEVLEPVANGPDAPPELVALHVRTLVAARRSADALPPGRRALHRAPGHAALRLELARALLEAGSPEEAAEVLHPLALRRADAAAAEIDARLAAVSKLLADPDAEDADARAERAWQQALLASRLVSTVPDRRDAVDVTTALAGLRTGHREGAATRLLRLGQGGRLARHVGRPWAALLHAVGLLLSGNGGEASSTAARALDGAAREAPDLVPELRRVAGHGLLLRAARAYGAGHLGAAEREARAAARYLPADDPVLQSLRAALAFRAGQRAAAARIWKSLDVRVVPEALAGLGAYHDQAGDRAQAQDYYRRYLAVRGRDDERVRRWLEVSLRFSRPPEGGGGSP